jgi:hypothetical protein
MENSKIADNYYKEAVRELNENTLLESNIWYSYVIHLPEYLQVIYTIATLHQQVMNGGFHQYFFNPYGQFAYLTLDHLNSIKAFESAELLEEALEEVNIDGYEDVEFRNKIFTRSFTKIADFDDDLFDFLHKLDIKYYGLNENLEDLFVNYLKNNNIQ